VERDDVPEIRPGPPAFLLGVATPVAGALLVLAAAARGDLAATPSDPVPPVAVAVVTLLGCVALGRRAMTQRAVLGVSALRCRNVLAGFAVEWDRIEAIEVVRRPALLRVDLHVRDLRRRQRVGAATRFDERSFDDVLAVLRGHPSAAGLLVDDGPRSGS
jgi:hypothetical protein